MPRVLRCSDRLTFCETYDTHLRIWSHVPWHVGATAFGRTVTARFVTDMSHRVSFPFHRPWQTCQTKRTPETLRMQPDACVAAFRLMQGHPLLRPSARPCPGRRGRVQTCDGTRAGGWQCGRSPRTAHRTFPTRAARPPLVTRALWSADPRGAPPRRSGAAESRGPAPRCVAGAWAVGLSTAGGGGGQ